MTRVLAICAILLATPPSLRAQAHPLAGTWDVLIPAGMRVENGDPVPIIAKGLLNVSVAGDSLIGMLKIEPPAGMPAKPASRLAARTGTGPTVFVERSKMTINNNGQESDYPMTVTYTFEATGDSLQGRMTRTVEGMAMPGPMSTPPPISGKRVKPAG